MADKQQTSVGGTVEVPANDTVTLRHKSDGDEFISLVEYVGSTDGALDAQFRVRQVNGNNINLVTAPDDGPDSVQNTDAWVNVPGGEGARFLTFVELDQDDIFEVIVRNDGSTSSTETMTFFASAASTKDVALGR